MKTFCSSRREFLIVTSGAAASVLVPGLGKGYASTAKKAPNSIEFKTSVLTPKTWPDGKPKKGGIWAVTASFPGPAIRVKEDDEVSVTVCNNLPEPTTLHWHGMHQVGTWFMDGVDMISQAPIQPGQCFTYRFKASPAGTHWYHSHTGVQYSDGLFGPLIVEERDNPYREDYDYDRIIMINDWFHIPSPEILANLKKGAYMHMDKDKDGTPDVADVPFESALVNGKGRFGKDSTSALEMYKVKPNDRIRFRIINASSTYAFKFGIDGHKLTVIATDGAVTKPHEVDSLVIDIGERYDVIVKADQTTSNYWIRAKTLEESSKDHALAVLTYKGSSAELPTTKANWGKPLNLTDLKPYNPQKIQKPTANKLLAPTGSMMPYKWMANGQVFEFPEKPMTQLERPPDPPTTQIKFKEGDVVRLVINNESGMSHPFHLHGHYFHVLGLSSEGAGTYNGQLLNEIDPILKDNLSIPKKGWAVIQWLADNPGIWFFHCHIEWHLAAGMAVVIHEGDPPPVPQYAGKT